MHPHHKQTHGHKRADHLLKGYKHGGAVHDDEAEDRKLFNSMIAEKKSKGELKHGGKVHGKSAHHRMDKRARGGKIKKKPSAVVNVMVGKPPGSPDMMMPHPAMMPPMAGPVPPPMGAGAPPVPGMPPMMPRKHGGRVKRADGGSVNEPVSWDSLSQSEKDALNDAMNEIGKKRGGRVKHVGEASKRTEEMRRKMANKEGHRSGGRVKSYPKMEAGAANGEGRLDKIKAYGKNARP